MYNYDFMNNDWVRNMNMNMDMNFNINNNLYKGMMNPLLFNPTDAYNYGNLFSNLYNQYKNYKPEILKPRNEREQLFLDLSRLSFAAHELNLYLDLHPEDESVLALFNDYRREANALIKQYETKYGPLNISSDSLEKGPFAWEITSWPWEDQYYV